MTSNTKGNKEKLLQNLCDHREDIIFFFHGGGMIGIDVTWYIMGTIDAKKKKHGILCFWPISLKTTSQNAVEKSCLPAVTSKIKFSGKVYIFLKVYPYF